MLKWVLHITYRMFSRYGEPKMAREGNDRAFAQLLQTHGGGRQLLEDHLALLARLAEPGAYLSPRVISLALQYVGRAVEIKESYALLKPHVDAMLTVVFPLTCFSEDDATLWDEDPQEYVRKGYDVVEDMYSTKTAAANLIHILVTKKPKAHMAKVMETIAGVFAQHAAAAPAVSVALARRMDGALLLVGSLSDVFKNKAPYKVQVETMLVTQVAPCFASPHGHLRSKAAWVAGCYSDIPFAAGDGGPVIGAGPNFMLLFERVINGMNDPELPVRVDSVVAMRAFVAELADVELLKPILPRLLESIFGLMAEVGSEDLVASLETIVEAAGEDIAPYAAQLAQNLTNAYWQYTTGGDEDDENDEGEWMFFCVECVRSVWMWERVCGGGWGASGRTTSARARAYKTSSPLAHKRGPADGARASVVGRRDGGGPRTKKTRPARHLLLLLPGSTASRCRGSKACVVHAAAASDAPRRAWQRRTRRGGGGGEGGGTGQSIDRSIEDKRRVRMEAATVDRGPPAVSTWGPRSIDRSMSRSSDRSIDRSIDSNEKSSRLGIGPVDLRSTWSIDACIDLRGRRSIEYADGCWTALRLRWADVDFLLDADPSARIPLFARAPRSPTGPPPRPRMHTPNAPPNSTHSLHGRVRLPALAHHAARQLQLAQVDEALAAARGNFVPADGQADLERGAFLFAER